MVAPVVQSSLLSAGADILSGAFGSGGSFRSRARDLRKQYQYKARYAGTELPGYVNQAKKAGLHPLFAMGASGGQSPSFSMQGQSPRGSFASDGLKAVSRHYSRMAEIEAKKDLINAQAQASALRVAENNTSNDTGNALVSALSTDPWDRASSSKKLAEYDPAKLGSHKKGNTFETGSEISPMTGIRAGSQTIQFPIAEADQLTEDPMAAIIGAYFYKGNQGVDWLKAAREYAGVREPTDYKNYHKTPRSKIRKEFLWGLVKFDRYYRRTVGR